MALKGEIDPSFLHYTLSFTSRVAGEQRAKTFAALMRCFIFCLFFAAGTDILNHLQESRAISVECVGPSVWALSRPT